MPSQTDPTEVHILNFKTTWSEFQEASQTATERGNAKLRIINFNPNQTDVWMPCQDWGVASAATSIYLGPGTNFCSESMIPQKLAWIVTHLAHFSEFFFQKSQKNGENCKSIKKLLKMSENSKFCNFWAISACNTSKESTFHIEFNLTQKKYDLFEEKLKKNQILPIFCHNIFLVIWQSNHSRLENDSS